MAVHNSSSTPLFSAPILILPPRLPQQSLSPERTARAKAPGQGKTRQEPRPQINYLQGGPQPARVPGYPSRPLSPAPMPASPPYLPRVPSQQIRSPGTTARGKAPGRRNRRPPGLAGSRCGPPGWRHVSRGQRRGRRCPSLRCCGSGGPPTEPAPIWAAENTDEPGCDQKHYSFNAL